MRPEVALINGSKYKDDRGIENGRMVTTRKNMIAVYYGANLQVKSELDLN